MNTIKSLLFSKENLKKSFVLLLFGIIILQISCEKKADIKPIVNQEPSKIPSISSVSPASGEIGTKVVILGANFSPIISENIVKFGSLIAVVDSATTIRLVTKIPKDATTGKITVEVGGKMATSSSDFSITQAPPTISGTGSSANVPVTVTSTTASIATIIEKE